MVIEDEVNASILYLFRVQFAQLQKKIKKAC